MRWTIINANELIFLMMPGSIMISMYGACLSCN